MRCLRRNFTHTPVYCFLVCFFSHNYMHICYSLYLFISVSLHAYCVINWRMYNFPFIFLHIYIYIYISEYAELLFDFLGFSERCWNMDCIFRDRHQNMLRYLPSYSIHIPKYPSPMPAFPCISQPSPLISKYIPQTFLRTPTWSIHIPNYLMDNLASRSRARHVSPIC